MKRSEARMLFYFRQYPFRRSLFLFKNSRESKFKKKGSQKRRMIHKIINFKYKLRARYFLVEIHVILR